MNYYDFIKRTGITIRSSYFDSAILPMYAQSGMSEQDFCKHFSEIATKTTGAKIITITDIGRKVTSDDFYQLHDIEGDCCTFTELLNSCDDTIGTT